MHFKRRNFCSFIQICSKYQLFKFIVISNTFSVIEYFLLLQLDSVRVMQIYK